MATVDPSAEQQELKFDINTIPLSEASESTDLNFSPNVVIPPESGRAFVSYTGSDQVAVFDLSTGRITHLIPVGKTPALITLTPDGKKLAVVSLFFSDNLPQPGRNQGKLIGSITVIETVTLQVKALELTNVLFSFANNIVFSADSKTGFVASSGTDEIIRFRVDDATEITPRLKLEEGSRPSALTMAADYSFLAAVLVGSPFVDRREVPDSVQIIDTANFSVRTSIAPEVKADEPVHDFFASDRVALTADGRFGLITDRENSSSGFALVPALATDHALMLDLQTGEVVKIFEIGGLPAYSGTTPNGKSFVVLTGLSLVFIEPATQELKVFSVPFGDFKSTTRPVFSADGSLLYIPAPIDDVLLVFHMGAGEFIRSVKVGKTVERTSGGVTFAVSAAPLDVSLSPDGSVITVLNFNANTVDLLRPTQRFVIPRLLATDQWFTGVAVTNNSGLESEILLKGFDIEGAVFTDNRETPEVVEVTNPVRIRLSPGNQLARTAAGLFNVSAGQSLQGWAEFDIESPRFSSFFMTGDHSLKRLDGGLASFFTGTELLLPEVRVTDGFQTEVVVVNPNLNPTTVSIALVSSGGTTLEEIDRSLVGNASLVALVRDPNPADDKQEGLFSENAFKDFQSGFLVFQSREGVIAFERYFDSERLASLNAIPLTGSRARLDKTQYAPQVALFNGSNTFLTLVYVGSEKASVQLTLKGNQGQQLAIVTLEMEPGQSLRRDIAELFGLTDNGTAVSGWVLVESSHTGIAGNIEIQAFSGKAMTAIPLQPVLLSDFVFSHVAQSLGLSTGVALVNPGGLSADVTMEVFDALGTKKANRRFAIPAGAREIRLLKELFPDLPPMLDGFIRITSDQPLVGLELFFADDLELMSIVPAQRVATVVE